MVLSRANGNEMLFCSFLTKTLMLTDVSSVIKLKIIIKKRNAPSNYNVRAVLTCM